MSRRDRRANRDLSPVPSTLTEQAITEALQPIVNAFVQSVAAYTDAVVNAVAGVLRDTRHDMPTNSARPGDAASDPGVSGGTAVPNVPAFRPNDGEHGSPCVIRRLGGTCDECPAHPLDGRVSPECWKSEHADCRLEGCLCPSGAPFESPHAVYHDEIGP